MLEGSVGEVQKDPFRSAKLCRDNDGRDADWLRLAGTAGLNADNRGSLTLPSHEAIEGRIAARGSSDKRAVDVGGFAGCFGPAELLRPLVPTPDQLVTPVWITRDSLEGLDVRLRFASPNDHACVATNF